MSIRARIVTAGLIALGVGSAVVVPAAVAPAPAHAATYFGAIAFSPSTGATGRAWDYPNSSQAQSAAMNVCYQSDCKVVSWFADGCGAIASSPSYWGFGSASNLYDAEAQARYNAGGGYIYDWVCTSGHS
ncbi:DUF4189 domain-containing protein [Gordonia humi]|uniref:Serine/threonine-protein kinase n=1 Tax=Gordonia humi TaxID=686429 RepID=A0A840F8M1_9ACTN|nr:DUF4189 domain-containing protein [Gordonia humi]MBB4135867.1 serine/threonine-protein kinase [Gordonia humi]